MRSRSPVTIYLHEPADWRKPDLLYIPAKDRLQFGVAIFRLHDFWEWAVHVAEEGITLDHDNALKTKPIPWSITARRLLPKESLFAFPWWRPERRKPILVPPEVVRSASAFLRTGRVPIPLPQYPPQLELPIYQQEEPPCTQTLLPLGPNTRPSSPT